MKLKLSAFLVGLASAVLFSTVATAETATGNATVEILETLTFVENAAVDFGSISANDGTCTMDATGALSGQCAGSPNGIIGDFTVNGAANQAVNVSVGGGSTAGGVTFNPVLSSAGAPTLDASGNATVNVVGSLDLLSATIGVKALTYTLTVGYQ